MTAAQFKEMLVMQNTLNNETNGKWWFLGKADNGKGINWDLAYCMERAELLDWYNWKHWVNDMGCKNLNEVKIEITDMAHFVLSKMLEVGYHNTITTMLRVIPGYLDADIKKDEDLMPWLEKLDVGSEAWNAKLEEMYAGLTALLGFPKIVDAQKETILKNIKEGGREKAEESDFVTVLVSGVLGDTYLASSKADTNSDAMSTFIIQEFYVILALADLVYNFDCDMLYKYFIGKQALNKFRQNNGYKTGEYRKIWKLDGKDVEDNDALVKLIDETAASDATIEHFYLKLNDMYNAN